MAGVRRSTLDSLQPEIKNYLIVGLIISRREPDIFQSKTTNFSSGERGVWNFTLRDSAIDFVNVTVWGSKEYIEGLFANFHIGQVVELINPKVTLRRDGDRSEMYVPSVSSRFIITLNQGTSDIHAHNSPDRTKFVGLLALPTKNLGQIKSLNVVLQNIEQLKDEHVDIMVSFMSISPIRQFMTKAGKAAVCRDIEVNDGSVNTAVSIRLWASDWVEKAELWQPRHTVLLLADVRIAFNAFKQKTILTIGRKTLITENPNVPQAQIVRAAARHLPDPASNNASTPDASSITNFMTIRQICEKMDQNEPGSDKIPFTAFIRVVINQMNFEQKSVVSTKCALCKRSVDPDRVTCINQSCPCGNGTRSPINVTNINLKLNVSDWSGHLVGCRLIGTVAEGFLKCNVNEFKAMSSEEREELKWRCVLEKCSIGLQVTPPTASWPSPTYNILTIDRLQDNTGPTEAAGGSGLHS